MPCTPEHISIVIPVAAGETAHHQLLDDLKNYDFEIIISEQGARAKSLNAGAAKSTREFLWFLHADSRVTSDNIEKLLTAVSQNPDALHYFDLQFTEGGMARLNAIGANVRSRLFGWPYGDQGFCMSKSTFDKIGPYPEDAIMGEDLLHIRIAKKRGVTLSRIPSKLQTSARKYIERGWLKLTILRLYHMIQLLRTPL